MTTTANELAFIFDIKTLMEGWNKIESAAKAQFPKATKEELYQICKGAMDRAMKP